MFDNNIKEIFVLVFCLFVCCLLFFVFCGEEEEEQRKRMMYYVLHMYVKSQITTNFVGFVKPYT